MNMTKIILWLIGCIVVCCGVHILGGSTDGIPIWQGLVGYVLIYMGASVANYGLSSNK